MNSIQSRQKTNKTVKNTKHLIPFLKPLPSYLSVKLFFFGNNSVTLALIIVFK